MSTTERTAAGARVGRARLVPGQLWQVPTFLVGLLAFLAVAASAPVRRPPEWWHFDGTVAALRQGLQDDQDPAMLATLAENALLQVHEFGDRAAEVHFLAGSVFYRQARATPPASARELWARCAEHLEEALQLGADEPDLAPLQYRLGRALVAQGRDMARGLELMSRAIDKGAEQPLAGYHLLVQAYLELPLPDLDAALEASRKIIELTDDREADALAEARFAHAKLLLRKDLRAEAVQELDRIGVKVSQMVRVKARLLQARCCEQEGMWSKALAVWQELLPDAAHVPGGKARILDAVGLCCLKVETPDVARATQAWQEALELGGPEGQAAGLRLGAMRLTGPPAEAARALDTWAQALAGLKKPADYRNPYLDLAEVRKLFDQALELFQNQQDYARMRQVAELYRKLAPAGQADEKVALAAEAQAKKLRADAAPAEEVRTCYRWAAEAFGQAAKSRSAHKGFDALWDSARCFLEARDVDRAADVLAQLDKLDQADERLAEGWFRLAEIARTANHADQARPYYLRCMQYALTPYAARARYQLALEAVNRKDWNKAEEILQPNLAGKAADGDAHQNSLYQMAWVQLQKEDFGRALFYLNQATGRYPNNPKAFLVRGQLAECYRRLADQAYRQEEKLEQESHAVMPDDVKSDIKDSIRHYRETRHKWLTESAAAYQKLADELRERARHRPLTDLEGVLARRALLGVGECHHDMGEYLEALRIYQSVQREHGKIEALIACERILQLKNLARKADILTAEGQRTVIAAAFEALPMALADLAKMDPNGRDFQGQGVWTWERWQQWLTAEQKSLGVSSKEDSPVIQ